MAQSFNIYDKKTNNFVENAKDFIVHIATGSVMSAHGDRLETDRYVAVPA